MQIIDRLVLCIDRNIVVWRILCALLLLVLPLLMTEECRNVLLPDGFANSHKIAIVWISFFIIVLLVIARELFSHLKRENLNDAYLERDKLKNAVHELNRKLITVERVVPEALYGILESVNNEMELGQNERISLYIVEENNGEASYFCCSRCSKNLDFEKRSCRPRPLQKMFKQLWDHGELYDDNFPSYAGKGKKQYIRYCKDTYGLTTKEVDSINFKGRTYYGKRIDYKGHHLGFMVVASMGKGINGVSGDSAIAVINPSCQKLGAIIYAFKDYIPSPLRVVNPEDF